MNRLSQLSSYTAAIVGSTVRLIANRSLRHRCCSFPAKPEYRGIRSFRSEFALTAARCYSAKKGRKSKAEPEVPAVVMEQEKDAFYVVRKGDVVGIYNSLADSQAQVGSSVCNPPVSVYKGYSLSKDTEEYLVSHGLKNALYTIRATDLKEDLFGMLVPCPFQEPSTKEGTSNKDVSKQRSLGVLAQDEQKVISEDPFRKQVKLEYAEVAEAPSHATRTCFVEFDGASKGNPGKAGAGAILRANDGSLICRVREGVGIATNNAAEYRAMILGMKYALKKGFTGICIQGDSKLVCMQIDGSWKVKNENLFTLYNVAKELKDKFSSFQISHVLRNFNSDADAQANLAINLVDGQVQEECV
ncbi:uncharacterized protein LOC114423201 isoform X1 [Glycine soja]|uniref:uncharacterized protein LOC114423201 isoform X1 n=1 Tax=Glycine soja TaxID=3848 RepID=UPI0003DEC472|nr:uncharacterized protein LOC114423201 isoform X1 [Glycine soja]|eukprot:XP_006585969.1 uncharacterized protein LOC100779114 isoform X1 [Glycine max]